MDEEDSSVTLGAPLDSDAATLKDFKKAYPNCSSVHVLPTREKRHHVNYAMEGLEISRMQGVVRNVSREAARLIYPVDPSAIDVSIASPQDEIKSIKKHYESLIQSMTEILIVVTRGSKEEILLKAVLCHSLPLKEVQSQTAIKLKHSITFTKYRGML